MPVQRLAVVVSHHICPGDSVIHGVKCGLIHDTGQKIGESRPVIKLGHRAALNLIGADCMIGGFELTQGWMIGREAGNFLFKIDVMGAFMHKGVLRDHGFHPLKRAFYGLRAQEAGQVEKPLSL